MKAVVSCTMMQVKAAPPMTSMCAGEVEKQVSPLKHTGMDEADSVTWNPSSWMSLLLRLQTAYNCTSGEKISPILRYHRRRMTVFQKHQDVTHKEGSPNITSHFLTYKQTVLVF